MAVVSKKREAPSDFVSGASSDKKLKPTKEKKQKKWQKSWGTKEVRRGIEAGDCGIWATCAMKQERKGVAEMYTICDEYVNRLYPGLNAAENATSTSDNIEDEIQRELQDMKDAKKDALYESIRLETPCLIFFRTKQPIDPVLLAHTICQDAAQHPDAKQGRYIKRLTPMTLIGKANDKGILDVAQKVLAPHFHAADSGSKKFAIRPNIRNNKALSRDKIIQGIADVVGKAHTVDLSNPDLVILVEMYQNICGMSVVPGPAFEQLKRFNLAEICDPTPKDPIPKPMTTT